MLRGGELHTVASAELVRGDVLVLGEGDAVGADTHLLSATALRLQEGSLTGESQAVTKDPVPLARASVLGDRVNMVYKGTSVVQGVGRGVVTGVGMSTEVGAIAGMLDATPTKPTPLENEIARISKTLGLLVVAIAIVVMVTIVLSPASRRPRTSSRSCCWGSRWPWPQCPRGCPPSCRWCSRSACDAWPDAARS